MKLLHRSSHFLFINSYMDGILILLPTKRHTTCPRERKGLIQRYSQHYMMLRKSRFRNITLNDTLLIVSSKNWLFLGGDF